MDLNRLHTLEKHNRQFLNSDSKKRVINKHKEVVIVSRSHSYPIEYKSKKKESSKSGNRLNDHLLNRFLIHNQSRQKNYQMTELTKF